MRSKSGGSDKPKGFLIYLDLAKQIRNAISPNHSFNSHRTGTILFMAIEIVQSSSWHNWRHDLELVLYAFIWLCVTVPDDRGQANRMALETRWGSPLASSAKYQQVSQSRQWAELLQLFAASMRGGAAQIVTRRWWEALVPFDVWRSERLMGKEGRDQEQVYKDMLAAVDDALSGTLGT